MKYNIEKYKLPEDIVFPKNATIENIENELHINMNDTPDEEIIAFLDNLLNTIENIYPYYKTTGEDILCNMKAKLKTNPTSHQVPVLKCFAYYNIVKNYVFVTINQNGYVFVITENETFGYSAAKKITKTIFLWIIYPFIFLLTLIFFVPFFIIVLVRTILIGIMVMIHNILCSLYVFVFIPVTSYNHTRNIVRIINDEEIGDVFSSKTPTPSTYSKEYEIEKSKFKAFKNMCLHCHWHLEGSAMIY